MRWRLPVDLPFYLEPILITSQINMKHLLLIPSLIIATIANAQLSVDSVSIGASYADQTWYSLENGVVKSEAKDNWDLAFEINGFSASILFNHVTGAKIWVYPDGDTASWASVDTTDIASWPQVFNDIEYWELGACNVNADASNPNDLGWGIYNSVTHHVTGDSLFIVETAGGDFKKLWIESLSSGAYHFTLANLDGSSEISRSVAKADYPDKNFAYYSIGDDQEVDREPLNPNWDLLFTQYALYFPGFGQQNATGILQNKGLTAARVYPVDTAESFEDYTSATFKDRVNVIGNDWKSINFTTFQWEIEDSLVYFMYAKDGGLWKLVMTGFGGSANGQYNFMKKEIEIVGDTSDTTTGISGIVSKPLMHLYPNPASSQSVSLVYDLHTAKSGELRIADIRGNIVFTDRLNKIGLQTKVLPTEQMRRGVYFIQIQTAENTKTEKLIIR
jgi:hypothetical protein